MKSNINKTINNETMSNYASQEFLSLNVLFQEELNLLFRKPELLDKPSAWFGHIPFAHWVINAVQPKIFVELGAHAGVSYSAFCSTVLTERIQTKCFAVDTWEGDPQAGLYSEKVFNDLKIYNNKQYSHFSTLIKSTFDEALEKFQNNSIDLLHIDGFHSYEAVSHDFNSWLPKLSDRAVVLFHDTNEHQKGFGVWQFWMEISQQYPSFEFLHSHGLGVLAVGNNPSQPILDLCSEETKKIASTVRQRFTELGSRWETEAKALKKDIEFKNQSRAILDKEKEIKALQNKIAVISDAKKIDEQKMLARKKDEIRQLLTDAEKRMADRELEIVAKNKQEMQRLLADTKNKIKEKEKEISQLMLRIAQAEDDKTVIYASKSWKLTKPLRFFNNHVLKNLKKIISKPLRSLKFLAKSTNISRSQEQQKIYNVLNDSTLFDKNWYISKHPDVAGASLDPILHYIEYGAEERRNPSEHFDTEFYLETYPDVIAAKLNPLYHYIIYGKKESRLIVRPSKKTKESNNDVLERDSVISGQIKLNLSVARRLSSIEKYKQQLADYQESRKELIKENGSPRIAIYTVIVGGYDSLKLPEILNPKFDYILFTDQPAPDTGVWQIRPISYLQEDSTRTSRYVKTHPHILLPEYDVAVWIDSNIMIVEDITPLIDEFLATGSAIAAIPHPFRETIYQEIEACSIASRDDKDIMAKQVAKYHSEGFDHEDLIESGFLILKLRNTNVHSCLNIWWNEIDKHSKRDQLSINYAFKKSGIDWHRITERPYSIRNHPFLAYSRHDNGKGYANTLIEALHPQTINPYEGRSYAEIKKESLSALSKCRVDIVVCVHNALDDVKLCLQSVVQTRNNERHQLIIVDDGSALETANYLTEFANEFAWAKVLRNEHAEGYTKAANRGLLASTGEVVILLNSDTIVTTDWVEKMVDALHSTEGAGIVGPLSNAASHQSIPEHKSSKTQTAINVLPPNLTIENINNFCERLTAAHVLPRVPLVHGFCFGITRAVINKIGVLDENNFPRGYGEENDYCFRASEAGFSLVIATHTYIYHSKSKSYIDSERVALMQAASKTIQRLHGQERIERAVRSMQVNPMLTCMREKAAEYAALSMWSNWTSLASTLPSRDPKLVSIVMCVFNQIELTELCLTSLFTHNAGHEFELILVDNGSTVETFERLRKIALEHSNVKLIKNEQNYNFAIGNNIGFAASRGSRIVFLNNDTEVSPYWLSSLVKPLEDPQIKGTQPKLLYPDGTIQCIGVVFSGRSPMGYPIYSKQPHNFSPTLVSRKFSAVTAACIAVRAEDFANAEGFDPNYINGQEDIDLCMKIGNGEKVFLYVPEATVIHHESKSIGRGRNIEDNRRIFRNKWKDVVQQDDFQYYAEDGLIAMDYTADNPNWISFGYAVWSPKTIKNSDQLKKH